MQTTEDSTTDAAITSTEAARLLGVSVSTAQLWMESGVLESWKTPGGHRRARRSAVLSLLNKISTALSEEQAALHSSGDGALFPIPDNEAQRLCALEQTGLLAHPDPAFDRITRLANQLLGTPISLITLLSADHQHFKSRQGVEICETPRSWAFCSHVIMQDELFMVTDAKEDARFKNNPLVVAAPYIRFYAGIPLVHDGFSLGTLCVIDREPRLLRAVERQALQDLAAVATDLIALRVRDKQQA